MVQNILWFVGGIGVGIFVVAINSWKTYNKGYDDGYKAAKRNLM